MLLDQYGKEIPFERERVIGFAPADVTETDGDSVSAIASTRLYVEEEMPDAVETCRRPKA